jgi:hypothetical protein
VASLRERQDMSVYVVAIADPDYYYAHPGARLPDGAGVYLEAFESEKDALLWILDPARPTYHAGDEECPLTVVSSRGVVL